MIPGLVLLAGGIASLVYGIGHHTVPVSQEQEIEIDIAPPPGFGLPSAEPFGPPGFGPPGQDFGDPSLAGPPPWMRPPPGLTKVKEKVLVTVEEPEWVLIREVTFGGVTLLSSGVLRRTYSGAPPSLCPT
jgi:hypothetical protein